jgi:hypothetical protein
MAYRNLYGRSVSLDPSSYRPGDETNPASPYYEEPEGAVAALINLEDARSEIGTSILIVDRASDGAEAFLCKEDKQCLIGYFENAIACIQEAADQLGLKLKVAA